MEFTITCPIDGAVEVSLEDIDNVVLRESDRADITFVCPHCGTEIAVTAVVPTFLMAAIEALADDPDASAANGLVILSSESETDEETDAAAFELPGLSDDPAHEAYCEYFRRQLDGVGSVDDALREMDSKA